MDDIFEDETILLIKKVFPAKKGEPKTGPYTYVVSKINGKWFVTGQDETGAGRTWVEFVTWLARGTVVSAKAAATFEKVLVVA